ncbi:MAG TPA: sensor histidine kinase [Solirubrobacteraceae bacterium]|nr:sensor histidine kinase [Solirubrobacteraceae bacterium]
MTQRSLAVVACAAVVAVLNTVDVARQARLGVADAETWVAGAAVYLALGVAVVIGRWPERRRTALLMLAWLLAGVVADAGLDWPDSRPAVTVWLLAAALQPSLYAHMVLSYPTGRVRDRSERGFLVVAYSVTLLWQLAPALFADFHCPGCSPHVPSLLFVGQVNLTVLGKVFSGLIIGLGLAFLVLVARRLRGSSPAARRTLLPLVLAAAFACAEFIVLRAASLSDWSQAFGVLNWIDLANLLVVPSAVLAGLMTIRRHRGPLGDLVIELRAARPDQIEPALARAVGDPSLELALWLPEEQRFVDCDGAPATVERDAPGRAVTLVGSEDEPVAAIVHDAGLVEQRALLEAAGSAASLAFQNARLQATLRAQLADLRASRARIVAAGDAERKRVERDLHDGAQQRLLAAGLALQLLAADRGNGELLAEAQAELQSALRELRELARGIHPAILTDGGLPAAVRSLVDRAPVPVTVDVPDGRYPEPVESAAYFVVSEALANVAKHAHARSAAVSVMRDNGRLVVQVRDDGRGGADDQSGTGLRGLSDRVGALNGDLTVSSAPGAGTTVRAEIPCGS